MTQDCKYLKNGCNCTNTNLTHTKFCPFVGKMRLKAPQACKGFAVAPTKKYITGTSPEILYNTVDAVRKHWGTDVRCGNVEITIKTYDKETKVVLKPRQSKPGWVVKKITGSNAGRIASTMRERSQG